jgi:DNA-binding Lrp family transcriptional regulator
MKKKVNVIASEESFNNLSSFEELEEMNKTVRAYKDTIRVSIKRKDVQLRLINLLELLKHHSCKQLGVSYMCKNTIAAKLEVAYKTVQRLMKKLEDLGMIRQVAMKRKKDMLQTSNAVLIVPNKDVSDKTPSKKSEKCPTIKTTSSSLKQKINNKERKAVSVSDNKVNQFKESNFIAHWVPEQFSDLASCFYNKAETVQEFWKVVKQSNRVIDHSEQKRAFTPKQELTIGIRAFKEFVMKIKQNKNVKNKFGYFNGIVNNLMDKLFFDDEFLEMI